MSIEKRSALMSRIKGKNTGPERTITRVLQEAGLVFETHAADLPGRPDFVLRNSQIAIFVDGDFWHGWRFPVWRHKLAEKWEAKIAGNRLRDARAHRRLRRMNWTVIRIWEHQIERNISDCVDRVLTAIESKN